MALQRTSVEAIRARVKRALLDADDVFAVVEEIDEPGALLVETTESETFFVTIEVVTIEDA